MRAGWLAGLLAGPHSSIPTIARAKARAHSLWQARCFVKLFLDCSCMYAAVASVAAASAAGARASHSTVCGNNIIHTSIWRRSFVYLLVCSPSSPPQFFSIRTREYYIKTDDAFSILSNTVLTTCSSGAHAVLLFFYYYYLVLLFIYCVSRSAIRQIVFKIKLCAKHFDLFFQFKFFLFIF